jgi:uncharacterized protein YjiK
MTEPAAASSAPPARPRRLRGLSIAFLLAIVALLAVAAASASAAVSTVNLAQYKRIERFPLPLPPGSPAPAHSLLAEEASGVTYDPVTETLFVVGDGGTSVVEVDKEGHLLSSMTLAPEASRPSGETFYDTEGVAYVGQSPTGKPELVITEERESKLDLFEYVPGGELHRADAKTVTIGTENDNIGIEGVTNDPLHPNTMIAVKESGPERIYSTEIEWDAGHATNFEAEEGELFPPSDVGTRDFSDVYALANVPGISNAEKENLLVISQESGEVVNITRSGHVNSRLAELAEPSDTISVPEMTNEGVTMDQNGTIYIVDEDGGGSAEHPQMWVYEPTTQADAAPSAVTLGSEVNALPESTTGARVQVATVTVTDPDGFGENNLTVTGPDASAFEVDHNGLYLKAGTELKASVKPEYEVSVQVDDPAAGNTPDATSDPYKLTVTPSDTSSAQIAITEVAPWSSGNSPVAADWFELTNVGTTEVDMTGWRINDNHNSFASSVPWEGVTSLAPGESAVLIDGTEATANAFKADWFASPTPLPAGFKIGWMPNGPGLSTGGDQVNVYDSTGAKVSGVEFGASPGSAPFGTFDNTAALGVGATVDPLITTLTTAGTPGAITADGGNEIGTPGAAAVKTPVAVTEVAPWGSSWPEYEADWFELTNESPVAVSLTGWRMTDSSHTIALGGALEGVTSLEPGESAIFVETPKTPIAEPEAQAKLTAFIQSWFGGTVPGGVQVGGYKGPGLGTGGDAVNISNGEEAHITGVAFGENKGTETSGVLTAAATFDNHAGLGNFTGTAPTITALSVEGEFGARDAHDQIGSPGKTAAPVIPNVKITEVDPTGNNAGYGADWFELTNMGTGPVTLTGWKIDDDSDLFASGATLEGVTTLAAGETAVFLEKSSAIPAFEAAWFPGGKPTGLKIGSYNGGPGLGAGGDEVNIFEADETPVTGVKFGAATEKVSFDNAAGIGGTTTPRPTISTPSVAGTNGAFTDAGGETGSPGTITNPVAPPPLPEVTITEVDPTGSAEGDGYEADWFELTNAGSSAVSLTGWKVDDSSNAFGSAVALEGISSIAAGETVLFAETGEALGTTAATETLAKFKAAWFGGNVPAGLHVGVYHGSGVGLSSGGDQVNIFEADGTKVTGVAFGSATTGVSFDNAHGTPAGGAVDTMLTTLSAVGTDGGFKNAAGEIGSPGRIVTPPAPALVATTPVFPAQAVGTTGPGQWVTVTNDGDAPATILDVSIEADHANAGDFLLAADGCTGEVIAVGASCEVMVRFSPGRENTTSSAHLIVASNDPASPLSIALTATSTGLPAGPKGDTGDTGPAGPKGDTGAKGDTGPKGDTGARGATGPAGPQGPAGKNGKNGKDGKDGVVSFTTSGGNVDARRGGTAHLQFKLENGTVGALSGAKLKAGSLSGHGTSTVKIPTLRAHETRKLTFELKVGKDTTIGRHKVKVELSVGGHTLTQTAIVVVSR